MNNGFYAYHISSDVLYRKLFLEYKVNELKNIDNKIMYFNNDIYYIKYFIEILKDRVIRKLPDLSSVKIELDVFDESSILHKFIIEITNMLLKIQNIKNQLNIKKAIFVCVKYKNEIVFIGHVDFTYIK